MQFPIRVHIFLSACLPACLLGRNCSQKEKLIIIVVVTKQDKWGQAADNVSWLCAFCGLVSVVWSKHRKRKWLAQADWRKKGAFKGILIFLCWQWTSSFPLMVNRKWLQMNTFLSRKTRYFFPFGRSNIQAIFVSQFLFFCRNRSKNNAEKEQKKSHKHFPSISFQRFSQPEKGRKIVLHFFTRKRKTTTKKLLLRCLRMFWKKMQFQNEFKILKKRRRMNWHPWESQNS